MTRSAGAVTLASAPLSTKDLQESSKQDRIIAIDTVATVTIHTSVIYRYRYSMYYRSGFVQ